MMIPPVQLYRWILGHRGYLLRAEYLKEKVCRLYKQILWKLSICPRIFATGSFSLTKFASTPKTFFNASPLTSGEYYYDIYLALKIFKDVVFANHNYYNNNIIIIIKLIIIKVLKIILDRCSFEFCGGERTIGKL